MADISKINPNGTEYNIKDAVARGMVEGAKTATGNPITLTDASKSYAEELEVTLEPIQDLHGYDKPWVGGAGKNLYVNSPYFEGYQREAGWTKATEKYNGHDVWYRANTWSGMYYPITISGGTTYTFSAMVKVDVAARVYIFGYGSNSLAQFDLPANTWTKVSTVFTPEGNIEVAFRVETGTRNVTVYISEYQLEKGNQATTYESYSNICPITGYTEVNVGRVGKNFAYIGNSLSDWIALKSDGTAIDLETDISTRVTAIIESQYGRVTVTNYNTTGWKWMGIVIPLKKNTNYIASGNVSGYVRVYGYNSLANGATGTELRNNLGSFNSGDYNYYVLAIYPGGSNQIKANSYMIEEGSTATAFEPYQSSNATISFGQTVYGCDVDMLTGEVVVDRGIIDFANVILTKNDPNNANDYLYYTQGVSGNKNGELSCSHAPVVSSAPTGNTLGVKYTSSGNIYINLTSNAISNNTVEGMRSYCVNNNVIVCYELATPQTYQLTPAELKLLKQYNYITTNGTTISLKYQPDNVIGEAIGVSEEYTDRKVDGKIYTKTVTGTVWVNIQSARMLILYNESEAWDKIPIAAFYSTYKCTPYYVYENDTYTWSILIHKSDGTNATDISSGASITMEVVYMEA